MFGRRNKPSENQNEGSPGAGSHQIGLGDLLRFQRATLGKSVFDVQRELRIKARYISAIENCDISVFGSQSFVAGYVRSYARYLKLDPEEIFARLCNESDFIALSRLSALPNSGQSAKLIPASQVPDPFKNSRTNFLPPSESWLSSIETGAIGSFFVLILLIGAIGYGGWSVLLEVQRVQLAPVEQAPTLVSQIAPELLVPQDDISGAGLSSVASSDGEFINNSNAEVLGRLYRPQALEFPVLVARDGPIGNINPYLTSDVYAAATTLVVVEPTPKEISTAEWASVSEVQVVDAQPSLVSVFAKNPAWVRVSLQDGTILFEKILNAGETYKVPQLEQSPILRAGNATSVYFITDGAVFGPASKKANVVRDVELSANLIKTSYDLALSVTVPAPEKIIASAETIDVPTIIEPSEQPSR
ncbi:MAG: cytoskeletal protein RodZ [Paracoccaceae bacterium]|jgi:cytoskeletal protein RodZ